MFNETSERGKFPEGYAGFNSRRSARRRLIGSLASLVDVRASAKNYSTTDTV